MIIGMSEISCVIMGGVVHLFVGLNLLERLVQLLRLNVVSDIILFMAKQVSKLCVPGIHIHIFFEQNSS